MSPRDILRGLFHAYLWGLGMSCLYFIMVAVAINSVAMAAIGTVYAALIGLVLCLPVGLTALLVFLLLRRLRVRAQVWMASLLSALLFLAIFGLLNGELEPSIFQTAAVAGLVLGLSFWHGAVGWRWSVDLNRARSVRDPG